MCIFAKQINIITISASASDDFNACDDYFVTVVHRFCSNESVKNENDIR